MKKHFPSTLAQLFSLFVAMFSMLTNISIASSTQAPHLTHKETIEINAPADKVWELVRDFQNMMAWKQGITKQEDVYGSRNQMGNVRKLTFDGWPHPLYERLVHNSDTEMVLIYEIFQGVYPPVEIIAPVSNYVSTISVKQLGKNKSSVTWEAFFRRADLGPNPDKKHDDKAALDSIKNFYPVGLKELSDAVAKQNVAHTD